MRYSFLFNLLVSSFVLYKKASALTPSECLQKLSTVSEKNNVFTGSDNVYCAYLDNDTIKKATFNIKNTKIEDWDITIGNWENNNMIVDNDKKLSIVEKDDKITMSISNSDTNAIVWILDDNKSGKITNVELTGTFVKRSLVRREVRYEAFQGNEFLWRDISWDNSNEKIIGSNLINVNNTVYFDSLTLLFNKEKTGENYFTGSYKILFNMQSDSSKWMVYAGVYNHETHEVTICDEWYIGDINDEIVMGSYFPIVLQKTDSVCNNNVIWWQNIKNEQNSSQRIWLKDIAVVQSE